MSRTASEIAWQMADLARELNYATLPHEGAPGLKEISDVYDVAGALKTMAQRLPQGLHQTSVWLGEQNASGKVTHAHRGDVLDAVMKVRGALEEGESSIEAFGRDMAVAHNESTWLKGTGE